MDADVAQIAHAVLGRFRFALARGPDLRHQRHVQVERIFVPFVLAHLADGFQEGQAFDVAHRAADLHDDHVHAGFLRHHADAVLDLIGDVRDHLHRLPQIIAAALLADDGVIHLAGGDAGVRAEVDVHEALVVAQVQVGLGAVVGDEDLAVLVRVHRARVHVQVRINFNDGDGEAAVAQEPAETCRGEPFPQR
ncbi:MAG: hypothetical protein BWY76_02607 [bacterium ADurb.Bin429]|nr:MAG: hypothetical protein BWY76_02607 [bacterium ADurb.Bin429]